MKNLKPVNLFPSTSLADPSPYSFRLFKVQFKCLMCAARCLSWSRWNVMNYYAIFVNFTEKASDNVCESFVCVFFGDLQKSVGTGRTQRDNYRNGSKLHVKFKFMDIPHEFVINSRIAFLL